MSIMFRFIENFILAIDSPDMNLHLNDALRHFALALAKQLGCPGSAYVIR